MKYASILVLLLLVAGIVHAAPANPTARNVDSSGQPSGSVNVNYEGQSNFTGVGAWGLADIGNPGYLVLKGCNSANACFPYYIWIGTDGKLKKASYITISTYASFPSGTWTGSTMGGTTVGSE